MDRSKNPFDFCGKTVTIIINKNASDILVDGKSYAVGVTEIHFDHVASEEPSLKLIVEPRL